ncbi:MAG TPA: NAD-dependent epimerase/dehydratase family protein [Pyrinomonadaceae bacterium]|nr:NAD-dependent epimerase/dehydratase family protein [Pyrinomonadaceae bacterium]
MRFIVTGCAGFIGSNLVDHLLQAGHSVVGYDNFSTGRREFLAGALRSEHFSLVEGDVLDTSKLAQVMPQADFVFHLAANADVRHGTEHPAKDLEQNTVATFNVLEAMRAHGIRRIAFTSTGSIYGEPEVFPTPETCPFPVQTSLYGASKLAAESLISAYCEGYDLQGYIFRLVSVLGERYSHGHVFDFYRMLVDNPNEIEVLGDGKQRKSYLYIQDCIAAMLTAISHPQAQAKFNIFNLGTDEYCNVDQSLGWITERLGLNPERRYTGGPRGWIGDSPFIFLDCARIRSLGWQPRMTIRESVELTLDYLRQSSWLFVK